MSENLIPFRAGNAIRAFVVLLCAMTAHAQNFTGRVTEDSTGDPVASAELKVQKTGVRELVADLDTDRSGRFNVALPAGDYTIDVLKPNFITVRFPLHIPGAAMQIHLLRYAVMDGRVTNVRGEPAAGIVRAPYGQTIGATRITVLERPAGSDEFRSVRDASLDEDGHFRFFDLPPGQYELGMWYYGINEGSGMQLYPDNVNPRVFTVAGGEVYKDLNFLIAPNPEYKVSGSVTLPAPKQNYVVTLGLPDQPVLPVAIALAAEDGTFHFDKVPAGTYDLFAAGPTGGYSQYESVMGKGDAMFAKMRIQVAASDLNGVSVSVGPARAVSVILRGKPGSEYPPGCPRSSPLELNSLDPWGILFGTTAQASADKEQSIANLAPGRFRIKATGLGARCYQAKETVVDLGKDMAQPVAIEVAAAGSVVGTLRSAGYVVVLLDNESGQSHLAFPGADGHFTFEALPPGRYRIAARPASEASKVRWVTNLAQMQEIDVAGGVPTTVDVALPAQQGGAQ